VTIKLVTFMQRALTLNNTNTANLACLRFTTTIFSLRVNDDRRVMWA